MWTEEQAATCIQARFRGSQWRLKQRRGIKAVTKLQALQRGRFTRREFAQLRDFSREQEGFQQATRRRQIRIWRNEQELYFLQHTNAADLERVREFQQQHAARIIQRTWRVLNQSSPPQKEVKAVIIDPNDRVFQFNLFESEPSSRFDHWRREKECVGKLQSSPSLLLEDESCASASTPKIPSAIIDEESFATRRKAVQERIKRLAAQEKLKTEVSSKLNNTPVSSKVEGANEPVNRRRELYEKVMAMKFSTSQRVRRYQREVRASRPDRELYSTQLVKSCENRLNYLQEESPEQMTLSTEDNQQAHVMEKWGSERRVRAWNHHRRAVCSVLDKRHWWQTQLAGEERDIRRVLVAKSPWEDENKIWSWPRCESSNQKDDTDQTLSSVWPSTEIQKFLVGDQTLQTKTFHPVSDDEASEWWQAHCMQSHLAGNGVLLIQSPYRAEFSNNVTSEGDTYPVCTSEVVANRDLYKLQQRAKRTARTKSLQCDVEHRMKSLTAQIERRVHEMETQVEANTQLALEAVRRKEERRQRITREQQAAMTIQRHARGMQGRHYARERRAEFFVMVRGRAIRRGRCEECGDERAVLECQQCEESVHFCPLCWVHVHSTRRRKTHVAIPMVTIMAPTPVRESTNTKPRIVIEAHDLVTSIKENAGLRLQSLPSPHKQNTARSAEPAPTFDNTQIHNASKLHEDAVHSAKTPLGIDTRNSTKSALAEACALARRVRTEVRESPLAAETELIPVDPFLSQEISTADSNEIHFPIVDGDGGMVDDVIVSTEEEQQRTIEPTEIVDLQPTEPEPMKLLFEAHEPQESNHSQLDAAVSASIKALVKGSEEQEADLMAALLDNTIVQSTQHTIITSSAAEDSNIREAAKEEAATSSPPDKAQENTTQEHVQTVNLTNALGVEAQGNTPPSDRPTIHADSPHQSSVVLPETEE